MPVPVFCCFCIPEKLVWKYSRNWTKLHGSPYFTRTHLADQRGDGEEPRGPHTWPGRGAPFCRALGWCGPHGPLQPPPFRLLIPPDAKTLKESTISPEEFRSSAATKNPNSGDRSLCFGTLPGRRIAPGAISIDATASIIAVAASHDEEGVVLHRG